MYSSVKSTTEDKLSTTDILRGIIAALATLCALAILQKIFQKMAVRWRTSTTRWAQVISYQLFPSVFTSNIG